MVTSSASLDTKPSGTNWVEETSKKSGGGLPPGVRRVARALKKRNPSWDLSRCIATALSMSKKWAAKGSTKGAANVAGWEKLRAANKARQVATSNVGGHLRTVDLADGSTVVTWQSTVTGRVIELARRVRTEAGAKRYGRPIGSPIGGGTPGRMPSTGTSGDRGGSRSGSRTGGSSPRRSGSAAPRTDGQGKALPKGQRTGGDYVREGLARRQAAEEKKRAKYEAQKDGQLRARQKAVAREWLAAKAAGTPATDRKQRERRAEVNALQAEISRRGQNRPQGAVGANATPADRLARMGEMERRTALRDMSDGDLKSARSELSARETSGKPSATKAAINAELERREGGKPAASPSPASVPDSIRQFQEAAARGENPLGKPRPKTGDKPLAERSDRELDGMQRRARDAVRKGDGGSETGRDQATASAVSDERNRRRQPAEAASTAPQAASTAAKPAGDGPALSDRLRKLTDGQLAAMDDALSKKGGEPSERHQAIRAERARRGGTLTAPGELRIENEPRARRWTNVPGGRVWSPAPGETGRKSKKPGKFAPTRTPALDRFGRLAKPRPTGGPLDSPGGMDAKKRAPAAPDPQARSANPKRDAAPGVVAAPPKAPAGKDPGESARPGPGQTSTPKAPGTATAATDPPAKMANTAAPKRATGVNGGQAGPDAPRGRRADGAPRTQGDDEDDALFAQSKARNEARRARGEKLPDPYADDQSTPPARPARATDAATGNRLQDYARADAAGRQQMVGSLSDAELNQLDGALGRAAERAPDDTVRSVLAGRRGEIDRERMRRRTAGMTDRPVAGSQDRQTPGDGAPSTTRLHMMDGRARNRAIGDMDDDGLRAVVADETSRAESLGKGGKQSRIHAAAQRELDKRGAGAPKVSTRDLLDRPASERRAAPAAIDAPRASAPVAPPQATSRPAPPGSNRAPGRIPDNRGTRTYNMPDRPIGPEQVPQQRPAADVPAGPGVGGGPNLSKLAELDDAALNAATARATEREARLRAGDPRRSSQGYRDAKLAADTLRAEQRKRGQAGAAPAGRPAAPAAGREFRPAMLNTGDRVRARAKFGVPEQDVEIVSGTPSGYIARYPDGRELLVITDDVLGPAADAPAAPAVPPAAPALNPLGVRGTAENVQARQDALGAVNRRAEQQGGLPFAAEDLMGRQEGTLFGPQNEPPAPRRTGSGTRLLNSAQIRQLQAQLIRETDPERKAALRARIAAGQGRGAVTRQMSQAPGGREVELAMGGTKGRGMADMSDEQLDKAEKRAAALARGRTGPAAARAARVMVAARGEKRRRKGSGASSAKSNRPPAFVKALSQPVELATAVSTAVRGTRVTTTERAAQIVGGTALGSHRYPRGA